MIIDKIIIEKLKKQTKETGRIVLMVSIIEKKNKEKYNKGITLLALLIKVKILIPLIDN